MVFNLIFHIVWYAFKGVQTILLLRWYRNERGGGGGVAGSKGGGGGGGRPRRATPNPPPAHHHDRRPSDVNRLFIAFAASYALVHRVVVGWWRLCPPPFVVPPPHPRSRRGGRGGGGGGVCSHETDFFCSEDTEETRRRTRGDLEYYLGNFGVRQTIEGNGEENMKMRAVHGDMEKYMVGWIAKYDHVESLKEKCINKHDKCVFWASINECTKNPGYMENDCMLACQKCERLLDTPQSKNER